MAAPILLVEGPDDKTFFEHLAGKYLGIGPDMLEVWHWGGKYSLDEPLKANVKLGVARVGVAKDLNSKSSEEVVAQIKDVLATLGEVSAEGSVLRVRESRIVAIPMGLYQDPALNSLGVTKHAMEDYLLKAFLVDTQLWRDANVPDAKAFLQDVLDICGRHGVRPTSSKDVWHFIKGLPEVPFGSRASIEWTLAHCEKNTFAGIAATPLELLGVLTEETP